MTSPLAQDYLDCFPSQLDTLDDSPYDSYDLPPTPYDSESLLSLSSLFPSPRSMYDPRQPHYHHYQPQPQPLQLHHPQQGPYAYSQQEQQQKPSQSAAGPIYRNGGGASQGHSSQGYAGQQGGGAGVPMNAVMGVGSQAGDFELFGPDVVAPSLPLAPPTQQQQQTPFAYQAPPQHSQQRYTQSQQRNAPYPYAIAIPPSSSSDSSSSRRGSENDYPSLPDLVPDEHDSPAESGSPPSPRFDPTHFNSLARPPFLSAAVAANGGSGGGKPLSYRASNMSLGFGIERPASAPLSNPPGPVRRKTQERRDWPSFYSSGSSNSSSSSGAQYMPQAPALFAQHLLGSAPETDEPASFLSPSSTSNNPFDPSTFTLSPAPPYSAQPTYSNYPSHAHALPHTDHPLLPSEQSDLLDRVRRDLLELDVDLSSIKGPLRALALGGGGSERDSTPVPLPAQLTPKALPLRSPATTTLQAEDAALSVGTVSPQEAFLDYSSVDQRLHNPSDPLFASGGGEFGVGVGGSLFAPLPTFANLQKKQQQQQSKPASPAPAPAAVVGTAALESPQPISPTQQPARRPHPFAVPQNAVTWAERRSRSGLHYLGGVVDGDADDDDGDFTTGEGDATGEEDPTDGEERRLEAVRKQARLGEGFARFRKEDADLKREKEEEGKVSEEERERYGLDRVGREVDPEERQREVEMKPFEFGSGGSTPMPGKEGGGEFPLFQFRESGATPIPQQQQHQTTFPFSFNTSSSSSTSTAKKTLPPLPDLLPAYSTEATSASAEGASTPRRNAAASALAGFNIPYHPTASSLSTASTSAAFTPTTTTSATAPAPSAPSSIQRPQRQRKRTHRDGEDDSDEEYRPSAGDSAPSRTTQRASYVPAPQSSVSAEEGDDVDAGHSSDASYHSSASSFGGGGGGGGAPAPSRRTATSASGHAAAPPPKRRRRAPAASSSSALANDPKAIRCDHVDSATGVRCGVAFRRPYDLARHKETIHMEEMGGGKIGRAKVWRCEECGGTFSRKDALLRHGRIRTHTTGQ